MPTRPPVTTNLPAEGSAGAVPPPNAPREISQPLQADAGGIVFADGTRMTPRERAAQNERELAPLAFAASKEGSRPPAPASAVAGKQVDGLDPFFARRPATTAVLEPPVAVVGVVANPAGVPPAARTRRIGTPGGGVITVTAQAPAAAPAEPAALPAREQAGLTAPAPPADQPEPLTEDYLREHPAASNSDSPGRGQMRAPLPPDKAITGGFGMPQSLQYFALSGIELRTVIESLMDQVHGRLQNDLRFTEAITYPRVTARVVIEVEGFAHTDDFSITQVMAKDHPALGKTPLEIARAVADEICLVVIAQHAEVDAAGDSVTPPDEIRDELGLSKPYKRQVGAGVNRQFVDIP